MFPLISHSFDDSSSISSGDISDTIAEISTDENLTGSSQGALSEHHPYNSLKRTPKDVLAIHGGTTGSGMAAFSNGSPAGSHFGAGGSGNGNKRVPNLGTSAFMGVDYSSDTNPSTSGIIGAGWGRKYSLTGPGKLLSNDPNKLLSSDPSEYGWPSSRSDGGGGGGYSCLRKFSNPDYAYFSEGDYDTPHHPHHRAYSPASISSSMSSPGGVPGGLKRDSETNTDQSHLLEASILRRLNNTTRSASLGSTPPSSNGPGTHFGYRRPLSNISSSSSGGSGNGKNSKSNNNNNGPGSSTVGSRLAKHGGGVGDGFQGEIMMMPPQRPASASGRPMLPSHGSLDDYPSPSPSSLERKAAGNGGLTPSKSTGCTQMERERERDYQSNSLGRRKLFGSKGNLSKSSHGEQSSSPLVGGTIISNPHATFGRMADGSSSKNHHQQQLQQQLQQQTSHYVNLQELHARIPGSSNYVPLEFASSPRNSSVLGPGSMWLKSSSSSNGVGGILPHHGTPPPPHPFNSHSHSHSHSHAMSDSETLESLAHHHHHHHHPNHHYHQQGRRASAVALGMSGSGSSGGRMGYSIADLPPALPPASSSSTSGLQRSNSIKSDSAYSSTRQSKHSSFNEELSRTGSFTQLAAASSSGSGSPQAGSAGSATGNGQQVAGALMMGIPPSPTLSQSSRFTYPMGFPPPPSSSSCSSPGMPPNSGTPPQLVVRSSTHSSLPYTLGKRMSRDEEDSRKWPTRPLLILLAFFFRLVPFFHP